MKRDNVEGICYSLLKVLFGSYSDGMEMATVHEDRAFQTFDIKERWDEINAKRKQVTISNLHRAMVNLRTKSVVSLR